MDRDKNSIQKGYQCKNSFVCCLFIFFYIFVSRSFPLPSAFLSTDIERGKVFGLNTLRRRKIQSETACRTDLSTFKGYCTTFADEQRKGANDENVEEDKQTAYKRVLTLITHLYAVLASIHRSTIILQQRYIGQAVNFTPSKNIECLSAATHQMRSVVLPF